MKTASIFLILFLLFWAIPFPMLIYYGDNDHVSISSPIMSLLWLGIAVLGWGLCLRRFFKFMIISGYTRRNRLANLMQNGELKTATIIKATPAAAEVAGINKYDLTVEMTNFVGTTIQDNFSINDAHPELNRYVAGKTLKLRIDKNPEQMPYIQVDGASYPTPNKKGLVIVSLVWLTAVAVVAWYFYFCFESQNNGLGWRFMAWNHPLVTCPFILLVVSFFMVFRKFTTSQLKHKYWGYRTTANVVGTAQTGVYINEQPQVRFSLEYTDRNNMQRAATFTKTIGVLDIPLTQQKTMDIFYLGDKPGDICLAADIEK